MLRSATDALALVVLRVYVRLRVEGGQTLAEYGMLISVLAVFVVVFAVLGYSEAIVGVFQRVTSCLTGTCGP